MPSKQLLSLKKDSPLPLDTRLNPITVEQQKLNQEIQDYLTAFVETFPSFVHNAKMDRRHIALKLATFWPTLSEWGAQAQEIQQYIDDIAHAVPAEEMDPQILLRIFVVSSPVALASLPQSNEVGIIAAFDALDGILHRYVLPSCEVFQAFTTMILSSGLVVFCQSVPSLVTLLGDSGSLGSNGSKSKARERTKREKMGGKTTAKARIIPGK